MSKSLFAAFKVFVLSFAVSSFAFASGDNLESQSMSTTETLIKGFAKYQASRIEKLVLENSVQQLSNNKYVELAFPKTANVIKDYAPSVSADRLIPLLKTFFEQDIENIKQLVQCVPIIERMMEDDAAANRHSNEALINDVINYFDSFSKLTTEEDIASFLKDLRGQCVIAPDRGEREDDSPPSNGTLSELARSKAFRSTIESTINTGSISLPKDNEEGVKDTGLFKDKCETKGVTEVDDQCKELDDIIEILVETNLLIEADKAAKNDSEKTPSVVYVNQLFRIIDILRGTKNYTANKKLKSYGIFLASLNDTAKTGNAEDVAGIIDQFIDEESVFRDKADTTGIVAFTDTGKLTCYSWILCENTFFLSSYFGVSFTDYDSDLDTQELESYRAFGPVGIEYKFLSIYGRSLSFNYAPFDIGGYVSNELLEQEYEANFDDIRSDTYFLSLNLRSKPVSIMIGTQKNVKFAIPGNEDLDQRGDLMFFAVAFDLPLFTLR